MRLNTLFSQARGGVEQDVLEAYCWMYSTWNIPKEYKGACSGGDQVKIFDAGKKYLFVCVSSIQLYYIHNKIRNFLSKDFAGNESDNEISCVD